MATNSGRAQSGEPDPTAAGEGDAAPTSGHTNPRDSGKHPFDRSEEGERALSDLESVADELQESPDDETREAVAEDAEDATAAAPGDDEAPSQTEERAPGEDSEEVWTDEVAAEASDDSALLEAESDVDLTFSDEAEGSVDPGQGDLASEPAAPRGDSGEIPANLIETVRMAAPPAFPDDPGFAEDDDFDTLDAPSPSVSEIIDAPGNEPDAPPAREIADVLGVESLRRDESQRETIRYDHIDAEPADADDPMDRVDAGEGDDIEALLETQQLPPPPGAVDARTKDDDPGAIPVRATDETQRLQPPVDASGRTIRMSGPALADALASDDALEDQPHDLGADLSEAPLDELVPAAQPAGADREPAPSSRSTIAETQILPAPPGLRAAAASGEEEPEESVDEDDESEGAAQPHELHDEATNGSASKRRSGFLRRPARDRRRSTNVGRLDGVRPPQSGAGASTSSGLPRHRPTSRFTSPPAVDTGEVDESGAPGRIRRDALEEIFKRWHALKKQESDD